MINQSTLDPKPSLLAIATFMLLSHVATAAEPRVGYEQTQNGVTVRIERIVFERVLNERAWLRRIGGDDWQQKLSGEQLGALLPGKCVTFSISFTADTKIIVQELKLVEFAKVSDQKYNYRGFRAFDEKTWQRRLDPLPVDPKATGLEVWRVVAPQSQTQDLFPAKLILEVTTEGRRKSTFTFNNVEF